jgi:predicted MPP superfamily phosphohydrolase
VLEPLHAAGWGQVPIGFVNGLDRLLQTPGLAIVLALGLRTEHSTTLSWWAIAVSINALTYFLIGYELRYLWLRYGTRPTSPEVAVPSRRRFLIRGAQVAGGGALAGLGYALVAEPRWFEVSHRIVPLRDLPESLAGLRLVQLTDIHHGPWLSRAYVRRVVEATNQLAPDVVLLTGDYVHLSSAYVRPVIEELAGLCPRIGTVAVLGNHDWWHDAGQTRRELTRADIPLIDNGRRIVTPDRRLVATADEGLALAGVGDFWQDVVDCHQALDGLPARMPRLLLSHNPDVAESRQLRNCRLRVDLMISGHTHGGQIRVPFLGTPVIPSEYGQKYAQGWVHGPACPVFICRGIGVSGLPVRVGVPPEIAVLELQNASLSAG